MGDLKKPCCQTLKASQAEDEVDSVAFALRALKLSKSVKTGKDAGVIQSPLSLIEALMELFAEMPASAAIFHHHHRNWLTLVSSQG